MPTAQPMTTWQALAQMWRAYHLTLRILRRPHMTTAPFPAPNAPAPHLDDPARYQRDMAKVKRLDHIATKLANILRERIAAEGIDPRDIKTPYCP